MPVKLSNLTPESRLRWSSRLAVVILMSAWLGVFWQSANMPFRVEQWDMYEYYTYHEWNFGRWADWLEIAFWCPFGEHRFIPGAYLWNFLAFKLLTPKNFGLWLFSVGLNLTNAAVLARWTGLLAGRRNPWAGVIATGVYLFSPPRQEIVMWTFFTYKVAWTLFILAALVAVEEFRERRRLGHLWAACALMFCATTIYEASLPLFAVFVVRKPASSQLYGRSANLQIALATTCTLALYFALRIVLEPLAIEALHQHTNSPSVSWDLVKSLVPASKLWIVDGILLPNTGLPVAFFPDSFWMTFATDRSLQASIRVALPIVLVVIGSARRSVAWVPAGYALSVGALGSGLVLIGRTATNGQDYLPSFGMYQHFPTIAVAAGVGLLSGGVYEGFAADPLIKIRRLLVTIGLAGTLLNLASSCDRAVQSYVSGQEALEQVLAVGGERVLHANGPVDVSDLVIPMAPTWSIPPQIHAYHVFHLLYGDRVLPPSNPAQ